METNNQKLFRILESSSVSDALKSELDYFMEDIEHEEEYTIVDAFRDITEREDAAEKRDAKLWNNVTEILIQIGFAFEQDLDKVIVCTGKKYWFKHKGKHFNPVSSWEEWINK